MKPAEIKKLRKRLKMSQQVFATMLGVGIATVSRWELGKDKPSNLAMVQLNRIKENTRKGEKKQ